MHRKIIVMVLGCVGLCGVIPEASAYNGAAHRVAQVLFVSGAQQAQAGVWLKALENWSVAQRLDPGWGVASRSAEKARGVLRQMGEQNYIAGWRQDAGGHRLEACQSWRRALAAAVPFRDLQKKIEQVLIERCEEKNL